MSACEVPGDNHSPDVVKVWHGEAKPMVLCGFHSTQTPRIYQVVRDARAMKVSAAKTPEQIAEIARLRLDPRLP